MAQGIRESAKPKGCIVRWPADMVSEFILFEPIEKKYQKSIEKHTEKTFDNSQKKCVLFETCQI